MQKIAIGQDTTMAMNAVNRQIFHWTENLILRGKVDGKFKNWLLFDTLPQFRPFIFGLMARIEGELLGEVSVVKVPRGEVFPLAPHDMETYFIPLNVAAGVSVFSGGEAAMLLPGDVWWTRGGLETKWENNSQEDFVMLLITAVPNAPATYIPEE